MAKTWRVGVIGRTGKGNYGHGLDTAWKTYPGVEIVGVADDNAEGLKQAGARLGVSALYSDYARMLREQKPQIVVIGPRWLDAHLEMTVAAAEARASVFMEKPMARTPAECDRMIDACERAHVKMAVAYNMRTCPILDWVQEQLRSGIIGDIQELRGRGKEDRRAGGEDMMVLGTHVFDLMRRFAGDPEWVFARIAEGDRDFRKTDVRMDGPEGMGPIGGSAIDAMYGFPGGRTAFFGTRRNSDVSGVRFGLDIYGSRGVMAIRAAHVPDVWVMDSVKWTGQPWKRLEPPAGMRPNSQQDAYHLMIDDLLEAIEKDREPVAGGRNARWTIEMAMGAYASHKAGGRVKLPLAKRDHPLP
jgi:predicted dehydrogenase